MLPNAVPAMAQGGREQDGGSAGLTAGVMDAGRVFMGATEDGRLGRVFWPPVEVVVYRKTVSVTRSVSQMKREKPLSFGSPANTSVLQYGVASP